jgi:NADPH:quinone reductase-like Zn-dependent oxidoreductase
MPARPRARHPWRRRGLRIRPVVNLVFGLEDAQQAAGYMRRQQAVGKIVAHRP